LNGYQVGYSFVPFKGPPGHYALDGGTELFSSAARQTNQRRNHRKIFEMYAKHSRRIDKLVRKAGRRGRVPFASQALARADSNAGVYLQRAIARLPWFDY
jgi:hypothetical protein